MNLSIFIYLFFIVFIVVFCIAFSLLFVSNLSYIPAIVFYLIFISAVILMFNYVWNYLNSSREYERGRRRNRSNRHRLQYFIDFKDATKSWAFILIITTICLYCSMVFHTLYQGSKKPSPTVTTPHVKDDKSKTSTNIRNIYDSVKSLFEPSLKAALTGK